MQNRSKLAYVYLIIGVVFLMGWPFIQNAIWPPPPKPKVLTNAESVSLVGGTSAFVAVEEGVFEKIAEERRQQLPSLAGLFAGGSSTTAAIQIDAPTLVAAQRRKEARSKLPKPELIALGHGEKPWHLQVLLNTRGGSVQQVVLTHFQQADREGKPVVDADGKPRPLHLIPGVRFERTKDLKSQSTVEIPKLSPGLLQISEAELAEPSYVMYHYEKHSDEQPVDLLGQRQWRIARNEVAADGSTHTVSFETELATPFYVKLVKTFTLKKDEYHLGLNVQVEPLPRPENAFAEKFRYQIAGPNGLPIEGEWYTSDYRQGIVGWGGKDSAHRTLEYSTEISNHGGSERYPNAPKQSIRFAGVRLQYFASVLALDNVQPSDQQANYIEFVRFTPSGATHKGQEFLDDVTFRAISRAEETNKAFNHPFILYQGPVKVRLLKQLEGEQTVPEDTVNRYRDDLALRVLTDAPLPNFFGRVANFIGWTDVVVAFTNLIHSLLHLLHSVIPNLGICIMMITIMVRGLLHPFSRRQMINAKIMQAKQEKLAPELKKLQEKYGEDFNRMNQEKMKLYREHGINPAAMFGGCLLLLCQMPIFMGLYYALQESIFLRLEPFFWFPNLAAPDMLARYGEMIPWMSKPEDLGGSLYLGPYLNLLPLIAVGLMLYTQTKMMPKSEDPQIQSQQRMMKFMMIFFAFFFYKVAAGLCIYFICSSIWGMIERRLIPKDIAKLEADRSARKKAKLERLGSNAEPTSWIGRKKAEWRKKLDTIMEEAQKQQQAQRDQTPRPSGTTPPGTTPLNRGNKKKKRK